MRGREVERTKAFVSRRVDHYRPSYGRRSEDHPRQCSFFGTTNADSYLPDETGNRRYWDIEVGRIDLADLRRDRDQLWAEAVHAYRAGETWWLDAEAEALAAEVQEDRRIVDVWEDRLLEWAGRQLAPFTIGEALTSALNVPVERQGRAEQMRVSAALKVNGWVRAREGGGGRQWRYTRKADPFDDPDRGPGGDIAAEVGTPAAGGWDASAAEVGTAEVGTDG